MRRLLLTLAPALIAAPALAKALADEGVRRRMIELGVAPPGGTPEEMDRSRRAEAQRWTTVVRERGVCAA
jgi:tripartite-type tricarboxylate transporter receptor subunit TctC